MWTTLTLAHSCPLFALCLRVASCDHCSQLLLAADAAGKAANKVGDAISGGEGEAKDLKNQAKGKASVSSPAAASEGSSPAHAVC